MNKPGLGENYWMKFNASQILNEVYNFIRDIHIGVRKTAILTRKKGGLKNPNLGDIIRAVKCTPLILMRT